MKLLFLLLPILCLGQKVEYYNYGYGGIEKGLMKKDSTVLFCDSLARPLIMFEVMDSLIVNYKKNKINPGFMSVDIKSAKVMGTIQIRKKLKLTVITYIYYKVIYSNGLIEIYRKPKKKK